MTEPIGFKCEARPVEPYREIRFIRQFIPDFATTCIQAGGHTGEWAAEYARHFKAVATFEPNEALYAELKENIKPCGNVQAFRVALGSYCGATVLSVPEGRSKCGYTEPPSKHNAQGTLVEQRRLDDYAYCCKVGLIHLDIEGAELPALKGAYELIQRDRPVIAIEHHTLPHMQYLPSRLDLWLWERGYREVGYDYYQKVFKAGDKI